MKLAIVTTHPIQYNAPWFALLTKQPGMQVKVFYTWEQSQNTAKHDKDFGRVIEWDLPLLEGYDYTFVKNVSAAPGSYHYKGIDNPTLNQEISDWDPSAVLIFGWAFRSHFACMRYFKGKIPVLFRGDSTLLDEQPGVKQIIRRLFLKYVYRHIDYALYVGANNKQYFKALGLKDKQLVFVPHAIDNSRFSGNELAYGQRAMEWRRELGIATDDFVILFAGKFIEKKDPSFMLRLAEKLNQPHVRFLMVGNGALEEQLKLAATDKRIIFAGFQNQSQMPVVYHSCDVFILPSLGPGETWGLALNEAMACGKYVLSTYKAGGAIDLVNDSENGAVVTPGDVNKAAEFINRLIEGKADKNIMLQTNKEKLAVFSFEGIVKGIMGLNKNIGA